ncbi:MAG: hypothetical protein ABIE55_02970 [Candidatus Aenigmatarchaeota archaeon]
MKKAIILCLVVFIILVATLDLPPSITGFAVKVTSTVVTIVKQILKSVLLAIANML